MTVIPPAQYEAWEAMILSDQVGPAELVILLADNPEFWQWCRPRIAARLRGQPVPPRSEP